MILFVCCLFDFLLFREEEWIYLFGLEVGCEIRCGLFCFCCGNKAWIGSLCCVCWRWIFGDFVRIMDLSALVMDEGGFFSPSSSAYVGHAPSMLLSGHLVGEGGESPLLLASPPSLFSSERGLAIPSMPSTIMAMTPTTTHAHSTPRSSPGSATMKPTADLLIPLPGLLSTSSEPSSDGNEEKSFNADVEGHWQEIASASGVSGLGPFDVVSVPDIACVVRNKLGDFIKAQQLLQEENLRLIREVSEWKQRWCEERKKRKLDCEGGVAEKDVQAKRKRDGGINFSSKETGKKGMAPSQKRKLFTRWGRALLKEAWNVKFRGESIEEEVHIKDSSPMLSDAFHSLFNGKGRDASVSDKAVVRCLHFDAFDAISDLFGENVIPESVPIRVWKVKKFERPEFSHEAQGRVLRLNILYNRVRMTFQLVFVIVCENSCA